MEVIHTYEMSLQAEGWCDAHTTWWNGSQRLKSAWVRLKKFSYDDRLQIWLQDLEGAALALQKITPVYNTGGEATAIK